MMHTPSMSRIWIFLFVASSHLVLASVGWSQARQKFMDLKADLELTVVRDTDGDDVAVLWGQFRLESSLAISLVG
jgi:hypothetical protein